MNRSVFPSLSIVCTFLIFAMVALSPPLLGQEIDAPENAMPAPPQPLDDDFHSWMIGEWEGSTTLPTGKSPISLNIEWGLDRQFVILREISVIGPNIVYKGMGLFTKDPASGDFSGHWFDNLRGVYKGTGKWEGNKVMMAWESPIGNETRTTEKVGQDKMVMIFKTKFSSGGEVEGRTELTRKRK